MATLKTQSPYFGDRFYEGRESSWYGRVLIEDTNIKASFDLSAAEIRRWITELENVLPYWERESANDD